jgi:hypothetical protein
MTTSTPAWTPAPATVPLKPPATVPLNPPATPLFVCLGADLPVYDYLNPCLDPCSCYCPPESSCYTPVCLYRSGLACVMCMTTSNPAWTPAPATVPLNPPATPLFVCIGADLPV